VARPGLNGFGRIAIERGGAVVRDDAQALGIVKSMPLLRAQAEPAEGVANGDFDER
jgi:hypothetical protein